MTSILQVGDRIYAQSIQNIADSYIKGFPQREFYLSKYIQKKMKMDFYNHAVIKNINDAIEERTRFTKYINDKKYDYILINNPLSFLVVENHIRIPIVFDCIDWYDEMYLKEFGVDKTYYLLRYALLSLLEKSDKVIAQSAIILGYLKKWGLRTKKTRVIPNGYDSQYFFPQNNLKILNTKKKLSQKYNIDLLNKKIIGYTGKLSKWYESIKTIINAVEENQIMLIVGDGPLLKSLPNKSNVIKCGPVSISSVSDYTNIADVLVFPVDDCSPIVISEYLAVGKPIVALKGRIGWLLKDNKTGYLVDNNVLSWKRGISKAITYSNKIAINNLNLSKELSWENLANKYIKFINSH